MVRAIAVAICRGELSQISAPLPASGFAAAADQVGQDG
jgi:hypothetical protein